MAIIDALQTFSQNQNLAQVAGTYDSSILDYGIATGIPTSANGGGARDMGVGDDPALKLVVTVTTTFTSGGAGTLQCELQGAIDNGAGAPAAFSVWWQSPVYALATLVQGERLYDMDFPRPPAGIAIPRFMKMSYIIGTATMTAGVIYSRVQLDREDYAYSSTDNSVRGGYPAGINVAN